MIQRSLPKGLYAEINIKIVQYDINTVSKKRYPHFGEDIFNMLAELYYCFTTALVVPLYNFARISATRVSNSGFASYFKDI
ncbi:hypothetical protein SAMN05660293_04290 [Dyadobacter psychrophilus]|uniref:Uncharacterized protein n=1 Tax=Dyadobacter psychrophilus TaxID=651661 RepID=A0A1T5GQX0_9BACT|nr:hypothetical protein SAMN05660293_04290 [Dyadobacter psychrophilus]